MNKSFDNIIFLLQCCIIYAENNAWKEFFERFTPIIQKTCNITDYNKRKEFINWFSGWLIPSGKLQIVYKKLKATIDSGELSSSKDQNEWFKSYFTHIVRSGISVYFKELNMSIGEKKTISIDNEINYYQITDSNPTPLQQIQIDEDKKLLKETLHQLDSSYRVPFVLTCCNDFLTDEDIAWISDQCDISPFKVKNLIEKEQLLNTQKKHPIAAPFIGTLINIGPDAVAQRVRRARIKLRNLLSEYKIKD
jgi:DNA-directed RNA polymerase specialized sigma24 family protein